MCLNAGGMCLGEVVALLPGKTCKWHMPWASPSWRIAGVYPTTGSVRPPPQGYTLEGDTVVTCSLTLCRPALCRHHFAVVDPKEQVQDIVKPLQRTVHQWTQGRI